MMRRCTVAIVGLALASGVAQAASAGPVAWSDPPIVKPDQTGVMSLNAVTGDVVVPGLGTVHGASFYKLHRGSAERPTPARASLMPPVLQIDKGSTFELHLHNHLTTIDAAPAGQPAPGPVPDATNVHTHGLVVPPTGLGFGTSHPRLGDCVLPLAAGAHAGMHEAHGMQVSVLSVDPCASGNPPSMPLAAELTYAYTVAADHPSGLFWLHPHPHGQSEIQLSNGLSGLLAIGSVWDTLFFRCRLTASLDDAAGACGTQEEQVHERALQEVARHGALRVRYLGLKDIQVRPRSGERAARRSEYDLIPFPHRPAAADQAFSDANDARKSRCGDPARPQRDDDVIVPGSGPMPQGICHGGDRAGWAFTVSGQVFPRIEVEPGSTEMWRIANMSADVSYRLQLKGVDGTLYRMRPVALDGVALAARQDRQAVGMAAGSKSSSTSGGAVAEIVLMPSARIEVLVERCDVKAAADGCVPVDREVRAVLHTRGMATGSGDNGDLWPAIDLADIVFRSNIKRGRPTVLSRPMLPPAQVAAAITPPPVAAPPSTTPQPSPAAAPAAAACSGYDHGPAAFPVGDTQVRLIRLNNAAFDSGEAFGIHDELTHLSRLSTGDSVTVAALLDEGAAAASGPSIISDIRLPDPCTDASTITGFQEYYRPFDPTRDNVTVKYGVTEYWLVINDSPECHNFHIHQMKFGVMDADFRSTAAALTNGPPIASDQCAGDRTAIRPINQAAFLDNYPVPPAARILFRVRFDGPKLGRFVFHCHILEHEDKGMMALLNVVP